MSSSRLAPSTCGATLSCAIPGWVGIAPMSTLHASRARASLPGAPVAGGGFGFALSKRPLSFLILRTPSALPDLALPESPHNLRKAHEMRADAQVPFFRRPCIDFDSHLAIFNPEIGDSTVRDEIVRIPDREDAVVFKVLCINNCFTTARSCDTFNLWSAPLAQSRVFDSDTWGCRRF